MNETAINWTELTWNPMSGCVEVSAECAHCYARQLAEDKRGTAAFPHGFDLTLRPHKLAELARLKKPSLIFCNSMSDPGLESLSDEYRGRILDAIESAPRHRYQLLTKRPDVLGAWLAKAGRRLPSSVWLGVTVGIAKSAWRLDALRAIPAAVHFVSAEPLLGDLGALDFSGVDWIIGGGESGRHYADEREFARRFMVRRGERSEKRYVPRDDRVPWAQSLRDAAKAVGAAFWWKQWGGPTPHSGGRMLDGRTWDDLPAHVASAMPEGYVHRAHVQLPLASMTAAE